MLCRALPTNPKMSYIHLEEITLDYCTELTDKVRHSLAPYSQPRALTQLNVIFLCIVCAHMCCRPYSSW
jgi:hypothetical protein